MSSNVTAAPLYRIAGAEGPVYIDLNGIRLGIFTAGPIDGPPIVLCHGFPELAYSWRHQIVALARAGYRVLAPDMRGYGHSGRPSDVSAYTLNYLAGDMTALLDHYDIDRAVFAGHDMGGIVVWHMPLQYPDRIAGVIGFNVPFIPRHPTTPLIDAYRSKYGDNMYVVKFQQVGVADRLLAEDCRATLQYFMRRNRLSVEQFHQAPDHIKNLEFLHSLEHSDRSKWAAECLLSEEELTVYSRTFQSTGFTGAINWYRNFERNWQNSKDLPQHISQPCLMIMADQDVVLPPKLADGMERYVPNLDRHIVKNCGHWTQQEHPDEVNRVMLEWLNKRVG